MDETHTDTQQFDFVIISWSGSLPITVRDKLPVQRTVTMQTRAGVVEIGAEGQKKWM
jgi:hypothetical protein